METENPAKVQARVVAEKATVAFKLGRFEEALEAYSQAYELFQASGLLFNIGQCHRHLGHHDKAVFSFSNYLRDNPSADNANQVVDLMENEKAKMKEEASSAPASSAPVQVRLPPPTTPTLLSASPATPVYKQAWFWTSVAGGALVVAAAVTVGVVLSQRQPQPGAGSTLGALDRSK